MAKRIGRPVYHCKNCGRKTVGLTEITFNDEEEARVLLQVYADGSPLCHCFSSGVYGLNELVGMYYEEK